MNIIEFKATVNQEKEEGSAVYLNANVLIDGSLPDDLKSYSVNMYPVKKSVNIQGAFGCNIFTCGCGIAECAGILKLMLVVSDETTVQWFVRWPMYRRYVFDRQQYINAFYTFREEAIALAGGIEEAKKMDHFPCESADELFEDVKTYPHVSSVYRVELHDAVEYEDIEAVKILVEKGYCSINHSNDRGETPLMLSKTPEMVKLLLSYGADITKYTANGNDMLMVISQSIYGCYDGNNLRYSSEEAEQIIEEIRQMSIDN